MTLYVRVASDEEELGAIQGHVREVTRALASTLRPGLPFRDAMSSRKGWDVEGVAGQRGVGAEASYPEGEQRVSVTLRAVWADESLGEQEWSVDTDIKGPAVSPAMRRRGQLIVLVGFHGAVLGALVVGAVLSPFLDTTAVMLGVMAAPFAGLGAAQLSARALPEPPPPPDPATARAAWMDEVRAAIEAHPDLRIVEHIDP